MPEDTVSGAERSFFTVAGRPATASVSMGSDHADDRQYLETYEDLRNRTFSDFLTAIQKDDRFYQKEYGADIIPVEWRQRGFDVTLPPTAYNAVHAAADHILTTPEISVPERPADGDYLVEQQIAAHKAQALLYFWHQLATYQGDPIGHGVVNLLKDGKVVIKAEVDFDKVDPNGARITSTFPFRARLIPNSSVFETGDPSNPHEVFEAYYMTVERVRAAFPDAKGEWLKRKAGDEIRVLEYWRRPEGTDKGARKLWVDDERVLNKVNPYYRVCGYTDRGVETYDGYVPYFISDSMWGEASIDTPPHRRYVGIIRHIHTLLETEARQLTMADMQLRISTFPTTLLYGIEEDDEKPIKFGPGAKVHIDDMETQKIETMPWPQLDPALFAMISRVHAFTNELAKFENLSGAPQKGVDTATEADQNFRNAASKLQGPVNGLRSLMSRMSAFVLWCIENVIEAPVTLYGVADGMAGALNLDPEAIAGFYDVWVELKTSDEAALDRAKMMAWANASKVFPIDPAYAMKQAGIKNPQQRIALWRDFNVQNDPRLHELRVMAEMQKLGTPEGQMLAESIYQQLLLGGTPPTDQPADPTAGGGFVQGVEGTPSDRNPNPGGPQQGAAGQEARASMFGQALSQRPDMEMR
jgi:hypothetical protein